MSGYLHGLAMRANLSANLKLTLAALCDAAGEDDGTKCHPSLAYVAFKTGFTQRHARRLMRTLELAGYIEPVAFITGGRGHTTWYHIHIKRVPLRPDWETVKERLIEAGELDAHEELPPGAEPVAKSDGKKSDDKRRRASKADILSAYRKMGVKADILSSFEGVKADILSSFEGVKADKMSAKDSYREEDPYKDDDSYDATPPQKNQQEQRKGDEEGASSPPPPPPAPDAGYLWSRAVAYLRAGRLGSQELASWIVPLRLVSFDHAAGRVRAYLIAPGTDHARIVEQRYHDALASALGSVHGLPGSRVDLSVATSVPMSLEVAR